MQHYGETHPERLASARPLDAVARALLAAFTLTRGLGCSSEPDVTALGEPGDPEDNASAPEAPGAAGAASSGGDGSPLYVVSTRVRSPENDTSYLIAVNSLTEQPDIDLSRSLEIAGTSYVYGPPRTGKVYISGEDGSMTEVAFGADGAVTPGRVVSFTGLGVASTSGSHVHAFVSPTKAYHVNAGTLDVIVWNPETMTITGSFPTGLDVNDGFSYRVLQQEPILVGERLVLVSFQADSDSITEGVTTLTVIDTASDQVISNEVDGRCSYFTALARDSQGDLYFASNWLHASFYFLFGDRVPHGSCMLRIRAGETRFDPEWSQTLEADLGTPIWTGVFPGPGGSVLVQALAEDQANGAVSTGDLRIARPWRWYEWDPRGAVQSLEADPALEAPLAVVGPVDDDFYLGSYLADLGRSVLIQSTALGRIRPGIEVPGQAGTVVRVY